MAHVHVIRRTILAGIVMAAWMGSSHSGVQNPQLEHMNQSYLSDCNIESLPDWKIVESDLKSLDVTILSSAKGLSDESKSVSKLIKDIDATLEQVDVKIKSKDLNATGQNALSFAEGLKSRVEDMKLKLDNSKLALDSSQKSIGVVYCSLGKYAELYRKRSEERKGTGAEQHDVDSAQRLETKQRELFSVMKEFDVSWGRLESLHKLAGDYGSMLDSLQHNLVVYISTDCKAKKSRHESCIYENIGNLSINRSKLISLNTAYADSVASVLRYVTEGKGEK